jgi:ABC-type multidrug transport system ATPase subunit
VSSHLLSEIEQVATHVGMMSAGRLVRQGTLDEVLADGAPQLRVVTPDVEAAEGVLRRAGLGTLVIDAEHSTVTGRLGRAVVEDVARELVAAGVRLRGLGVDRPDLEDLFVAITGEGFDVLN